MTKTQLPVPPSAHWLGWPPVTSRSQAGQFWRNNVTVCCTAETILREVWSFTRAFSWLNVPTSAFTFKTLLRLVGTFNKGCITLGNFKLREGSFPALVTMWRCVVWMVYAVAVVCPAVYIPSYLFLAVTLSGVTLDICWGFAVINCPDSTHQLPRCLHSVSGNSWYPIFLFTRPVSSSLCRSDAAADSKLMCMANMEFW